ncbi:MAG: hypothetical protein R3B40_27725 [Polyangiales bacterium]|nr:hypothetical protein [Sandaracinaceae bacterium]
MSHYLEVIASDGRPVDVTATDTLPGPTLTFRREVRVLYQRPEPLMPSYLWCHGLRLEGELHLDTAAMAGILAWLNRLP